MNKTLSLTILEINNINSLADEIHNLYKKRDNSDFNSLNKLISIVENSNEKDIDLNDIKTELDDSNFYANILRLKRRKNDKGEQKFTSVYDKKDFLDILYSMKEDIINLYPDENIRETIVLKNLVSLLYNKIMLSNKSMDNMKKIDDSIKLNNISINHNLKDLKDEHIKMDLGCIDVECVLYSDEMKKILLENRKTALNNMNSSYDEIKDVMKIIKHNFNHFYKEDVRAYCPICFGKAQYVISPCWHIICSNCLLKSNLDLNVDLDQRCPTCFNVVHDIDKIFFA